jgi:hypothetical protein
MSLADTLATIGVAILLGAFALNSRKVLTADSRWYNLLTVTGAVVCGYSAYLVEFYPFVAPETQWAAFALISLPRSVSRETLIINNTK